MAAQTPEGKVTKDCLEYLKLLKERGLPIYWEHRSGQGGYSYKKGLPDLFIVIGPYHIEAELKTINGKRSAMQDKYKKIFESHGTPYVCPHSFSEFKEYIDKFLQ